MQGLAQKTLSKWKAFLLNDTDHLKVNSTFVNPGLYSEAFSKFPMLYSKNEMICFVYDQIRKV